ncbi:hypothetical protein LA080_015729 [Diaporthe eres]|nr:hypothetical protein LA080_015729 [Diaporthe eres]
MLQSFAQLHLVSPLYLAYPSPALRQQISICQTTHHHELHHHHHRSALAWKVPGKPLTRMHAAAELYCLQCTAVFQVGVPWAYAASGNPHPGGKLLQALQALWQLWELQLRAGERHMRLLAVVPAQIAICQIADPHPLHHGKGVHPATRPLLWIVPSSSRIWAVSRAEATFLWDGTHPRLRPPTCNSSSSAHSQHATHAHARRFHVTADVEVV